MTIPPAICPDKERGSPARGPLVLRPIQSKSVFEILRGLSLTSSGRLSKWIKKGIMCHLDKDFALYAELFKRKEGDKPKAKENLNKAIEILKECGAKGWLEKYEKEIAALS